MFVFLILHLALRRQQSFQFHLHRNFSVHLQMSRKGKIRLKVWIPLECPVKVLYLDRWIVNVHILSTYLEQSLVPIRQYQPKDCTSVDNSYELSQFVLDKHVQMLEQHYHWPTKRNETVLESQSISFLYLQLFYQQAIS